MPLHVQRQVIAARETPLADDALERLGAGVLPIVSRQLIGSGEAPLAVGPLACVRLLACGNEFGKRKGWKTVEIYANIHDKICIWSGTIEHMQNGQNRIDNATFVLPKLLLHETCIEQHCIAREAAAARCAAPLNVSGARAHKNLCPDAKRRPPASVNGPPGARACEKHLR